MRRPFTSGGWCASSAFSSTFDSFGVGISRIEAS